MADKKNIFYRIRVIAAVLVGILSLGAFFGILYPVRIFDLQAGALLQRVFIDFSIAAIVLLAFIIIATLLFGRIYCSTLCPLGLLQEFIGIFKSKTSGQQKNFFLKYIIAAIVFGTLAGGTVYVMRYIEPYTYFGSAFTLSLIGIVAVVAIMAIVLKKDRFFCTNICPVGTLLGLVSKFSVNKIYLHKDTCASCGICEKMCPAGCIDAKAKTVSNENCVKCLKCLNVCNVNAVKYGIEKKKEKDNIKFDPKRRQLILAASTVAVFAAAAKAGAVIKNKVSENFSDVILPPGAQNEERFANKCLNCNLCVQVCPTKVIKKADMNYGAVSIDYSKNFCDYECNKCSAACPAGALKKLSLEEKKRTRIAMITPPDGTYEQYKESIEICPTQALTKSDSGKVSFSASKCIGCGACKTAAIAAGTDIAIYGTKLQKML